MGASITRRHPILERELFALLHFLVVVVVVVVMVMMMVVVMMVMFHHFIFGLDR